MGRLTHAISKSWFLEAMQISWLWATCPSLEIQRCVWINPHPPTTHNPILRQGCKRMKLKRIAWRVTAQNWGEKINRCASHQTLSFLSCVFLRNMTTNTIMSFETVQIKLCCFTVWHRRHTEGWVLRTNLPYTQLPLKYKIQLIRFFFVLFFLFFNCLLAFVKTALGTGEHF